MRWLITMCFVAVSAQIVRAEDETTVRAKEEKIRPITSEENQFIKDVEAKFGINEKDAAAVEIEEPQGVEQGEADKSFPNSLPAVIAIEIVNDTNSQGKEKRTIDANLGYGYKTNTGYAYTYFGKPKEERGKFMIYPYSQEDIPPPKPQHFYEVSNTQVDIQPSKAFELVPFHEPSYHEEKTTSRLRLHNDHVQGIENPPPPQNYHVPSTLYTTYEAGHLSQLSGHFPKVMPSYLVDSNQLLHHPQYQGVGITPEHLRPHAHTLEQRIVPVLILRIPSSHLQNPTAELYPNLPANYPLSNYLNGVNLQQLVSQYLHQLGYEETNRQAKQYVTPVQYQYMQSSYEAPAQTQDYAFPNYESQSTGEVSLPSYHRAAETIHQPQMYEVHQQQEPERSNRYLPPTAYIQQTDPQMTHFYHQQPEYPAQPQYQIPQGYEHYTQEQYTSQPAPKVEKEYISAEAQGQKYNSAQDQPNNQLQHSYQESEQSHENFDLPISENYPSKDHTQVRILTDEQKRKLGKSAVQTIAYVTPSPGVQKYYKYKVMAPQPSFSKLQQPQRQTVEYTSSEKQYEPNAEYTQLQQNYRYHSKRLGFKMVPKSFRKPEV